MTTKRKAKKRTSDIDKYVRFSLIAIITFTIVAIVLQFVKDVELSSTLITAFYAVFGGELYLLCMIKKLKLKQGGDKDDVS